MTAKIINVDPLQKEDIHYRYKMPEILIKHESRGNGAKTVFPNIRDVCVKLQRPAELLNKFFGNELGAQASFLKADDKFLVMGHRTQDDMQNLVYKFIERLVLCKKCRSPETEPTVDKKGKTEKLPMKCRSCGAITVVPSTEKIHKYMVEVYKTIKPTAVMKGADTDAAEGAKGAADKPQEGASSSPAADTGASDKPAAAESAAKVAIQTTAGDRASVNPPAELANWLAAQPSFDHDAAVQKVMEIKADCNVSDKLVIRFVFGGVIERATADNLVSTLQTNASLIKTFAAKDNQHDAVVKEVAKACIKRDCHFRFPMALKALWEEGALPEADIRTWVEKYKGKEVPEPHAGKLKEFTQPLISWFSGDEIAN